MALAAGVLYECTGFQQDNCKTLVTTVAKYSAKLLKKPDQCRMVQRCCPLFWSFDEAHQKTYTDEKRSLVRLPVPLPVVLTFDCVCDDNAHS